MPNNHEDELAYIQAKFWLDKSPLKNNLLPYKAYQQTDRDWRRDIEEAHNDTLFFLQKLRPFFMRGDGRGPIRPPEPTLVALGFPEPQGDGTPEPVPADRPLTGSSDIPKVVGISKPFAWNSSCTPRHLRARNTITLIEAGVYKLHWNIAGKMGRDQNRHLWFDRLTVSDANTLLPYETFDDLTWDSASLTLADGTPGEVPFKLRKGKKVSFSNFGYQKNLKAPSTWGSLTMYFKYTPSNAKPRTFHFDLTFSHPSQQTYRALPPLDFDALSVECATCGAKAGDLCRTKNGTLQVHRTHRPRRRLFLSLDHAAK